MPCRILVDYISKKEKKFQELMDRPSKPMGCINIELRGVRSNERASFFY